MKSSSKALLLALLPLMAGACYHATVNTAARPGTQVFEKPWATSLIYGLVAPETVEATEQCPNGVARVETRHSFLNGLVAALTMGIYTPMHVTVTCAAGEDEQEAAGVSQTVIETSDEAVSALAEGRTFFIRNR